MSFDADFDWKTLETYVGCLLESRGCVGNCIGEGVRVNNRNRLRSFWFSHVVGFGDSLLSVLSRRGRPAVRWCRDSVAVCDGATR